MGIFDKIFGRNTPASPNGQPSRFQQRSFNASIVDRTTTHWKTWNESSNRELRYNLRNLRGRARDLCNNNEYAARFLELCSQNIVGPDGVCMEPRGRNGNGELDEQNNELIEEAWDEWGRKGICTLDGQLSWRDAQNLIVECVARDGEFLIRPIIGAAARNKFNFAIQLIEADYLDDMFYVTNDSDGSGVFMGVEVDKNKRVSAYHLLNYNPGDYGYSGNAGRDRIPADQLIHVYLPKRGHQRRGYPWITPSMKSLYQLGDFKDSELTAARVSAAKMGYYTKTDMAAPGDYDDSDANGGPVTEVEPGMFEELPFGWDVKTIDWQHPNIQFGEFTKACLRGSAVGMGVGYNTLAGDLEGVNYSSLREGRLENTDMWRKRQRWFIDWVCQPVFSKWLDMAQLSGAIPIPARKLDSFRYPDWQPRGWQWVDPQKEIEAHRIALSLGLTTRSEILASQGKDFADTLEQLKAENEMMRKMGLNPDVATTGSAPTPPANAPKAAEQEGKTTEEEE